MGDPDACNERGLRALQLAIAKGHLGMVCLPLERSVRPRDNQGHPGKQSAMEGRRWQRARPKDTPEDTRQF